MASYNSGRPVASIRQPGAPHAEAGPDTVNAAQSPASEPYPGASQADTYVALDIPGEVDDPLSARAYTPLGHLAPAPRPAPARPWQHSIERINIALGKFRDESCHAEVLLDIKNHQKLDDLYQRLQAAPAGIERCDRIKTLIRSAKMDLSRFLVGVLRSKGVENDDSARLERLVELFVTGVKGESRLPSNFEEYPEDTIKARATTALLVSECRDQLVKTRTRIREHMQQYFYPKLPPSCRDDHNAIAKQVMELVEFPDPDAMLIAAQMPPNLDQQYIAKATELQTSFAIRTAIIQYADRCARYLTQPQVNANLRESFSALNRPFNLTNDEGRTFSVQVQSIDGSLKVEASSKSRILEAIRELTVPAFNGRSNLLFSEFLDNGCYFRAHLLCDALRGFGLQAAKIEVRARGDTTGLRADAVLRLDHTDWVYHIAPLVFVEEESGTKAYVLDPAFPPEDGPLITPERWIAKLALVNVDVYVMNDEKMDMFGQTRLPASASRPMGGHRANFQEKVKASRRGLALMRKKYLSSPAGLEGVR